MQTCSNCGATVREGAKFCTSCGTRLNDSPASSSTTGTTGSWQSPESGSSTGSVSDSPGQSTATWSAASDTSTTDSSTSSGADSSSTGGDTFNWSWGSPSSQATETQTTSSSVDEESGTVLDESGATTAEPDEVRDATEVEILEDEPATSDEESVDSQRTDEPASSATGGDQRDSDTLAAWAGQWQDDEAGTIPATPLADRDTRSTSASSAETEEDDKEDTVAKAERLIGELRSIIPTLARPRPPVGGRSSAGPQATEVADELESAARVGNFDDIRDALLAARDNPRDIDSMVNLSAKVDRLLELFDDRNNLAKTAESVARRLRGSQETEPSRDRTNEL